MFPQLGQDIVSQSMTPLARMWAEAGFLGQPFAWKVPLTMSVCSLATLRQMPVGTDQLPASGYPRDELRALSNVVTCPSNCLKALVSPESGL